MDSSSGDRNSNHDHHVQQEQGVHGEASDKRGHSGEGAASAMAHMIQQDQKHRRQSGEGDDAAPQG